MGLFSKRQPHVPPPARTPRPKGAQKGVNRRGPERRLRPEDEWLLDCICDCPGSRCTDTRHRL